MKCPCCQSVPMEPTLLGPAEVHSCGQCGAVWLDALQGERLRRRRQVTFPDAAPGVSAAGGSCPRCAEPLVPSPDPDDERILYGSCGICSGLLVCAADRGASGDPAGLRQKVRRWLEETDA